MLGKKNVLCDIQYISIKDFLKHTSRGVVDLEIALDNLRRVVAIWQARTQQNILVDIRDAELQASPAEAKQWLEEVVKAGIGRNNRVALLYQQRPGFDLVRFVEFLSARAGLGIKACENWDQAIAWLSEPRPVLSA